MCYHHPNEANGTSYVLRAIHRHGEMNINAISYQIHIQSTERERYRLQYIEYNSFRLSPGVTGCARANYYFEIFE